MNAIQDIATRHDLFVIEDAAQAVGATYHGRKAGSFGAAGCFSLHPLKNLHACGDAGIVTTNDRELASRVRQVANHGLATRDRCDAWGYNSRLDGIQAAILNALLPNLDAWTDTRRNNAAFYDRELRGLVDAPMPLSHECPVYHTYVVQLTQETNFSVV